MMQAGVGRRLLLTLAVVLLAVCCDAEIHRARAINSKPYHAGRATAVKNRLLLAQQNHALVAWNVSSWLECVQDWTKSIVTADADRSNVWIYSMVSAGLVGLSGIFPLLVIPIEAGEALKRGGSANNKLKLLLSFAVGGLLGDVFLHLLPEAWAHLDKLGGTHDGNIEIGCWVLLGLLLFMIIEKLFPETDDEQDEQTPEGSNSQLAVDCSTEDCLTASGLDTGGRVKNGFIKNGYNGKNGYDKNGSVKNGLTGVNGCNGLTALGDGVVLNGTIVRNGINSLLGKNGLALIRHKGSEQQDVTGLKIRESQSQTTLHHGHSSNCHIKTSGWLNLMANVIDNFTHGLAVAGSFSVSTKTGLITTFAILLHEIPHEIGDFAILLRAGFDRWRAAKAQMLTATGGILGAIAALSAESAQSAGDSTAWILPFTSGGFIYIAMVTVLPDLLREGTDARQSLKQFLLVCTGIAVMAAVTLFVE